MKILMCLFKQEGTQMYSGVMRAEDLLRVAKVDVWRHENNQELGHQRAPETARTTKVTKYLQADSKPLMPTSVVLSYRGSLETEPHGDNTTIVEIPEDETLWVVDGQHRIYGFKRATMI